MFERYAIFYTPVGALADFGAAWLGWDSALGKEVPHLGFDGLDVAALTQRPRKYGLHATLKAPFRLSQGTDLNDLKGGVDDFVSRHKSVQIGQLELRQDRRFVALRPIHETLEVEDFASSVVKEFDKFRAPSTDDEIARRRKSKLTPLQDHRMLEWGYPYIFSDFNFHITLTGRLQPAHGDGVIQALNDHIEPMITAPLMLDAITLMGEATSGKFRQLHRRFLQGD